MSSESKYQSKIINKLKKDGWYVIKIISASPNGLPDILALKDGEKPYFIEVKAKTGRLSEIQKYRLKELKELNFNAEALYSK